MAYVTSNFSILYVLKHIPVLSYWFPVSELPQTLFICTTVIVTFTVFYIHVSEKKTAKLMYYKKSTMGYKSTFTILRLYTIKLYIHVSPNNNSTNTTLLSYTIKSLATTG